MSTEHQRYSIENQKFALAAYASDHGFRIVRSYIDAGKSGLRIEYRAALKQLIDEVQNGQANFSTILVYDVSRWGRFQDVDESAHYEFLCKSAGVPVQYCAEQFENNGTLAAQIIKSLKRAMAGEYSRELSTKVFEGHMRGAQRGDYQGGTPAYGFRRLLVDERGNPRSLLRPGERKHFQTDHVELTPGPPSELRTVRRIYRLFVHRCMPRRYIARLLNAEGHRNAVGKPWTDNDVLRVLTNEKYIGNVVYARTSKKLLGPCYRNPPERWIRREGVLQRVVHPDLFASAQHILAFPQWAFTDNQLLDCLSALWCKHGYLTSQIITKSKFAPAVITYRERFGSLPNAYRLIGYKRTRGFYHWKPNLLCPKHRDLLCRVISAVQDAGGVAQFDEASQCLRIDEAIAIAAVIIPYSVPKNDLPGWTLRLYYFPTCDFILVGRLNDASSKIIDYHLLPRCACPRTILQFTKNNLPKFKSFKLRSIVCIYQQCKKLIGDIK